MENKTVFIIDDDPSVRRGIKRLLMSSGLKVWAFASAREFLESEQYENPGCIILDVRMPEITGPELQNILNSEEYTQPIIFLSGHTDVPTSVSSMKKGAFDFLTKPVERDVLLATVHAALANEDASRIIHEEKLQLQKKVESLTPREYEIMTYVISGMLNKQIACELGVSYETVKIHRGKVMHKLGVVSVAKLVSLCSKIGVKPAENIEYN